jgi:hypothetical protein
MSELPIEEKMRRVKYLRKLMEGYKHNPSNANKYFSDLEAIVFDDDWHGMELEDV